VRGGHRDGVVVAVRSLPVYDHACHGKTGLAERPSARQALAGSGESSSSSSSTCSQWGPGNGVPFMSAAACHLSFNRSWNKVIVGSVDEAAAAAAAARTSVLSFRDNGGRRRDFRAHLTHAASQMHRRTNEHTLARAMHREACCLASASPRATSDPRDLQDTPTTTKQEQEQEASPLHFLKRQYSQREILPL